MAGRSGEAVRAPEQIEDRRDDRRADHDADDERDLLAPRRRVDELACLEVLQVVVRDRRDAEHDRGDEERVRDERGAGACAGAVADRGECEGGPEDGQDRESGTGLSTSR